jgi:hypothetical protein
VAGSRAQRAACCVGHGVAPNARAAGDFSSEARAQDTRDGGPGCYAIEPTVAEETGPMYEKHVEPVLTWQRFRRRVTRHGLLGFAIIAGSLLMGTIGYRQTEGMPWVDALLNASMILTGMGPVTPLTTTTGKLFAAAYALYSGLVFVAVTAILLAPFLHRLLHQIHATSR